GRALRFADSQRDRRLIEPGVERLFHVSDPHWPQAAPCRAFDDAAALGDAAHPAEVRFRNAAIYGGLFLGERALHFKYPCSRIVASMRAASTGFIGFPAKKFRTDLSVVHTSAAIIR